MKDYEGEFEVENTRGKKQETNHPMPNETETVASKTFTAYTDDHSGKVYDHQVVEASFAQKLVDEVERLDNEWANAVNACALVIKERDSLRQQLAEANGEREALRRDFTCSQEQCAQVASALSLEDWSHIIDFVEPVKELHLKLTQLAATERQLREALLSIRDSHAARDTGWDNTIDEALSLPPSDATKISAQHEAAGVTTGVNNATKQTEP